MRKMKKFLAVTLSAAMVLSVSVPAMAAGRVASNTEVAMNEKSLEDASAKAAEAEKAFEAAKDEWNAAKEALKHAKEEAAKDTSEKITKKDVDDAKAAAESTKSAIDRAQQGYEAAEKAYEKAKKDEQEALTEWVGAKKAYEAAEKAKKDAQKAYDNEEDVDVKEELAEALAKANKSFEDAEKEAKQKKVAYDGEADLKKEGKGGTVGASEEAKTALESAEKNLNSAKSEARNALRNQYQTEAAYNEQKSGKGSIAALEAAVAECEAKVAKAKEALDAAKRAEEAAQAKLSEAGRKVAAENLEKAKVNEQQKAYEEEKALEALKGAKSEVDAIQAQIDAYLKDIADFEAAITANDEAQKAAADAAADVLEAQATLAVAEYGLELAEKDYADIPAELEKAEAELRKAIADKEYMVSPNLAKYLEALSQVGLAESLVHKYTDSYYTDAVGDVLTNATAAKEKAEREYNEALRVYDAAERAAEAAEKALPGAFAKYQKAIKALYVTTDADKAMIQVLYGEKTVAGVKKPVTPVEADADGNATGTAIYRYSSMFVTGSVNADNEFTPDKDAKGVVVSKTPAKLKGEAEAYDVRRLAENTYAFTDEEAENIVDWKGDAITTTNSDSRLDFGDPETDVVRNPKLVKSPITIPTTLYSMLDAAKTVVKGDLQDAYDKAVEAHKKAAKELGEAEAEYEFYFGNKADEPSQAVTSIIDSFKDVDVTDWFAPYVADVVDKGIMKGMNSTLFGSYDTLQRQDFVVILWRLAGEPQVNQAVNFADVAKGSYYEEAIRWAYSEGVARGFNETEFGVGKQITREDFTVMLHRFNKFPSTLASIDGFKDASKVSGYAVDAVKWAVATGAITGKDNGTIIDPQAPIARCEAAKILSTITD